MSDSPKQSVLKPPQQSVLQAPRGQSVIRASADVVFVVDRSMSMTKHFITVSKWLSRFVEGINSDPKVKVDLRFGLLCYDARELFRLREYFTDSAERFASALEAIGTGKRDEITLPALDRAIRFPWRDAARRFIVVITDEPTETGTDPDWQRSMMPELTEKLLTAGITLLVIAPDCETFAKLEALPNCRYRRADRHAGSDDPFDDADMFADVVGAVGKDVSKLSSLRVKAGAVPDTDLYDLASRGVQEREV